MKAPLFYSKILLFGEYVIKNSKGLSIPYNFFKGGLKIGNFENDSEKESNKNLIDFKNHLKTIESSVVDFDFITENFRIIAAVSLQMMVIMELIRILRIDFDLL